MARPYAETIGDGEIKQTHHFREVKERSDRVMGGLVEGIPNTKM